MKKNIKLIDKLYNFGMDGIQKTNNTKTLVLAFLVGLCIGVIPFVYNLTHKETQPLTEAHKAQIAIEWLTQYEPQKTAPSKPDIKPAGK